TKEKTLCLLCLFVADSEFLPEVQLPDQRIPILLINDFNRAVVAAASIPRKGNQNRSDKKKEQGHSLRTLSHPALQARHRERVHRESIEVRTGKKCQMRLRRQIRTCKRHLIEFEEQNLSQQRRDGQPKCKMKCRFIRIGKCKLQWRECRINRQDAAQQYPPSRRFQKFRGLMSARNLKHPIRAEFIRDIEGRSKSGYDEER